MVDAEFSPSIPFGLHQIHSVPNHLELNVLSGGGNKRIVRTLSVLLIVTSLCSAQWVQTNGPYGRDVYALATSGTNLFAGTGGGGVVV